MSSASGKPDFTGWNDVDKVQFSAMERLGIASEHWSPTNAHRSKQTKEKKRLELRGIREHNERAINSAQRDADDASAAAVRDAAIAEAVSQRERQREEERAKREAEAAEREQRVRKRRDEEESREEAVKTAKTVRSVLYRVVHEVCEQGDEPAQPPAQQPTVLLENVCRVLKGEPDDCEAQFWDRRRLQLRSDGSIWMDPHDKRWCRQIAAPPYELWLCAFSTIPGIWGIGVIHTWGYDMLYDTAREPIPALFARCAPRRNTAAQPVSAPRTFAEVSAADPLGVSLKVWPRKFSGVDDIDGHDNRGYQYFDFAINDNTVRDRWHEALRAFCVARTRSPSRRPWNIREVVENVWPERGPWNCPSGSAFEVDAEPPSP